MISFAGVPLSQPEPAALAGIALALDWDRVLDFERQSGPDARTLGWPVGRDLRDRRRTLNSLFWPRGASSWATAHVVCTGGDLERVRRVVYSPGAGGYAPAPFVMADGAGRSLATQLYLLPPRPIDQVAGSESLWLLTLVDARWLWWQTAAGVTVAEGTTSWLDLLASVAAGLGTPLTVSGGVSSDYLRPAGNLSFAGEDQPLAWVLDSIAYNVGRRVVRLLDGTVLLEDYATAAASVRKMLADPTHRKYDGGRFALEHFADLNALVPSAVELTFPAYVAGVPTGTRYRVAVTLASLALPLFANVRGNGRTRHWNDEAVAEFASPGDPAPQNDAELQALAKRFAADWYELQLGSVAARYCGTPAWTPDALHEALLWEHSPAGLSCRVERGPVDDAATRLCHRGTGYRAVPPHADALVLGDDAGTTFPVNWLLGRSSDFLVQEIAPLVGELALANPGGTVFVNVENILSLCGTTTLHVGGTYYNWYDGRKYLYLGACLFSEFCDCGIVGLASGSGSASGGSGGAGCNPLPCGRCAGNTPITWTFTAAGFAGKCATFNGDWTLAQIEPCAWRGSRSGGRQWARIDITAAGIGLTFHSGGLLGEPVDFAFGAAYSSTFDGDCCAPFVVFSLDEGDCDAAADAAPATVTAYPHCCGPGGGGGGSGGGGGTILTDCCPGVLLPATLAATLSNRTGSCTCLPDAMSFVWTGGHWEAAFSSCGGAAATWALVCVTGVWQLAGPLPCSITSGGGAPSSGACSPFALTFDVTVSGCCAGTAKVIITR